MEKTMMDEGEDDDVGIWMNEENQSAFEPLTNNNCFHVDIQEQGHHEMNGVLEKKKKINVKTMGYPKRENGRKEWPSSFFTFKVVPR
jgi:hypothetical protein